MHGTMLWFNEDKDVGSILTEQGERLSVRGDRFADGKRPEGRCAGIAVTFQTTGRATDPWAEDVRVVPVVEPRRARSHRSAYR